MYKQTLISLSLFLVVMLAHAEQLADPTKPLSSSPYVNSHIDNTAGNYHLTSVFFVGQKARAIINNAVLSVGDTVGEYTVIDIKRQVVRLRNGDDIKELRLFKQAITQ